MRIYAAAMLLMLSIGFLWQRVAVITVAGCMALVWCWLRQGGQR